MRDKYWHPSNVLYHYGDDDCPLAQGDFGHAMRLVQGEASFEAMQAIGDTSDPSHERFMADLKAYSDAGAIAEAIWDAACANVSLALEGLRDAVTKTRAAGNTVVADNLDLFADALESDDYASLAI